MNELAEQRAALHRMTGPGGSSSCDLRVRPPDGRAGGVRVDGECTCRDLVVDMIVEAYRLLAARGASLHNPPGAVRTHLRTRATGDWIRRRRLAVGAQARCDRIRTGARARGLPDEYHRAVLEFLVDEAGSPAPLDGPAALCRRLAVRAADEFGGEPADHLVRVTRALVVVERHCRGGPRVNDGTATAPEFVSWWDRYIDRPLGRRPCRSVGLPDDLDTLGAPVASAGAVGAATVDGTGEAEGADAVVLDRLLDAARRCPGEPVSALRDGLADLVARGLVPARVVDGFLGSGPRVADAARELSTLT